MSPDAEQIFTFAVDLVRTQAKQLQVEPTFREITANWAANRRANNVRIDAEFARLIRARGLR